MFLFFLELDGVGNILIYLYLHIILGSGSLPCFYLLVYQFFELLLFFLCCLDLRQELFLEATVSFTFESLLFGNVQLAVCSDLSTLDADLGCRRLVAWGSCC